MLKVRFRERKVHCSTNFNDLPNQSSLPFSSFHHCTMSHTRAIPGEVKKLELHAAYCWASLDRDLPKNEGQHSIADTGREVDLQLLTGGTGPNLQRTMHWCNKLAYVADTP